MENETFDDKAKRLSPSQKRDIRWATVEALSRGIVLSKSQIIEAVAVMIFTDELLSRED